MESNVIKQTIDFCFYSLKCSFPVLILMLCGFLFCYSRLSSPPPPPPTPTQPNDIMRPGGNGWAEMVLAPPGQGGGATITQPVRETGSNYSMDHARAVTQKSERERRMRERERGISVR